MARAAKIRVKKRWRRWRRCARRARELPLRDRARQRQPRARARARRARRGASRARPAFRRGGARSLRRASARSSPLARVCRGQQLTSVPAQAETRTASPTPRQARSSRPPKSCRCDSEKSLSTLSSAIRQAVARDGGELHAAERPHDGTRKRQRRLRKRASVDPGGERDPRRVAGVGLAPWLTVERSARRRARASYRSWPARTHRTSVLGAASWRTRFRPSRDVTLPNASASTTAAASTASSHVGVSITVVPRASAASRSPMLTR